MNKDILEKLIAELKVVLESLGKLLTNPNNYERKFSDAIRSGIFFSYSTLNCLSVEYHSLYRNQLLIFKLFLLFLMKCFTTNSEVDPELLNDEKIVEYSFIFNYLFSHFDHVDFSLMLQNETTTLRSLLKTYFNVVSVKKELASGWFSLMWIESFDISNESLNSSILKSRIRKLFDDARFPSYDILKFYFQHTTDHEIMVNLKTLINFDEEDNTLLRRWFMSDYCSLFDDLANITERYSPHNSIEENLKYPINCLTYILCNCFEALGFKLTSQLEGWLMNNLNEGIFNMSMVVRIIYKLSTYSGSSKYILGLLSNLQICSCLLLNINIKEDEFCSILIFWNMVQDDPHLATSIFAEEIRDYDFETDTNELRVMAHLLFENDQEVLAMELSSLFEEYIESDIDYELKKDSIPVKILLTTLLKFFTNDPELNQFMIKLNRILLTRIKMWSSELYRSIIYYLPIQYYMI
ncbi:hypothetical protein DFJ63DRAFT_337332 [Scheffersomyces coipomensis]|uniref:uncharacterized protein n=1 Tax=Scheffersomyces coipomensis TaxID=1788519 RepID=UPI00315DD415